jgi:hypothetical protein
MCSIIGLFPNVHLDYGEPSIGGWPFVSSTFGAFDLAGNHSHDL